MYFFCFVFWGKGKGREGKGRDTDPASTVGKSTSCGFFLFKSTSLKVFNKSVCGILALSRFHCRTPALDMACRPSPPKPYERGAVKSNVSSSSVASPSILQDTPARTIPPRPPPRSGALSQGPLSSLGPSYSSYGQIGGLGNYSGYGGYGNYQGYGNYGGYGGLGSYGGFGSYGGYGGYGGYSRFGPYGAVSPVYRGSALHGNEYGNGVPEVFSTGFSWIDAVAGVTDTFARFCGMLDANFDAMQWSLLSVVRFLDRIARLQNELPWMRRLMLQVAALASVMTFIGVSGVGIQKLVRWLLFRGKVKSKYDLAWSNPHWVSSSQNLVPKDSSTLVGGKKLLLLCISFVGAMILVRKGLEYLKESSLPSSSPDTDMEEVIALYDFQGEQPGDLTFFANDRIQVLGKPMPGWWEGRLESGQIGLFPQNYVRVFIAKDLKK